MLNIFYILMSWETALRQTDIWGGQRTTDVKAQPVEKQNWMNTLDRGCMAVLKHLCGFKSSAVAFVEL